jgi:hypothetical protein
VGGGVQLGPLGTAAIDWPTVPAPGDYDDGEFGGMKIGRGNRSTRIVTGMCICKVFMRNNHFRYFNRHGFKKRAGVQWAFSLLDYTGRQEQRG